MAEEENERDRQVAASPPAGPAELGRSPSPRRARPAPRRRGRTLLRLVARLLVLAAVFLIGLAVGRALEDTPRPGGSQTGLRTLEVATLQPAAATTVTVTVTGG